MIPENRIEDIFKQGYSTKTEPGHGIGLFIVTKIVREAGGQITVSSKPDKTCFEVIIPKKNEGRHVIIG